jgi:uncharacterized membrane protein YjfL (UPF0719 family)
MFNQIDFIEILKNISYLVEVVFFIFIGKAVLDFVTPYSLKEEFTQKDNLAVALSSTGYLLSVAIICLAASVGVSESYLIGLVDIATYGSLGLLLLFISKIINDNFILKDFSIRKELIEDKNVGTGAVLFGTYLCSALIVAGSIMGEGGGPLSALIFFLLGQMFMVIFTIIYQYITPFDLHKEIEADNVAAGVAFGGTFIAIGLILFKGLSEDFLGWRENLVLFLIYGVGSLLLLVLVRFIFIKCFVLGVDLNQEISEDRNVGIAILEAATAIIVATALYFII